MRIEQPYDIPTEAERNPPPVIWRFKVDCGSVSYWFDSAGVAHTYAGMWRRAGGKPVVCFESHPVTLVTT